MNALIFQHSPSETPGTVLDWLRVRKIQNQVHHWYRDNRAPDAFEFDWLIILGGAMNVDDYANYPWLKEEKAFLKEWLAEEKPVIGLCLGAQLLGQALGGKVTKAAQREIGFHDVTRNGSKHPALKRWPESFRVYQFHEDTVSLPPKCTAHMTSPACALQAFSLDEQTLGLQFHPESTGAWIRANASSVKQQPGESYVQSPTDTGIEIARSVTPMTTQFFRLLDDFAEEVF